MKVITDFIKVHKLPENIDPPKGNMLPHKLFSYITDLMAHSMGTEKREEILKELKEYKESLPFDLR